METTGMIIDIISCRHQVMVVRKEYSQRPWDAIFHLAKENNC